MANKIQQALANGMLVNTGSGNGLLPNSTKPLSESVLIYHHLRYSDIHSRIMFIQMIKVSIYKFEMYTYEMLATSLREQWVTVWSQLKASGNDIWYSLQS